MVGWIEYPTRKGNNILDIVQALVKKEKDIVLVGVGHWMVAKTGAGGGGSIGVRRNADGGRHCRCCGEREL